MAATTKLASQQKQQLQHLIVITGASRGIGQAIARAFAKQNNHQKNDGNMQRTSSAWISNSLFISPLSEPTFYVLQP